MLVLLHFHALGYTAVELAYLFLLYEVAGVVTNLFGGYLAARLGLKATLTSGLALQVVALTALAFVPLVWAKAATVAWVMGAQVLSGVAKDLTKMSSKSALKVLVPPDESARLFRWVALLTGSKNALKGLGFFVGGALLSVAGFRTGLLAMAAALVIVLAGAALTLPAALGKSRFKPKFTEVFSKSRPINVLAAARLFLFATRDVWFVVGVPVFLATQLGWSFTAVGSFLALWVVGYGVVQSLAPALIARWTKGAAPTGRSARVLALALAVTTALVALSLSLGGRPSLVLVLGLAVFGAIFALNSSVHSFLILAYSDGDKVAMNVGFYYTANALGRLLGTLLSGVMFTEYGLAACLWTSVALAVVTVALTLLLPRQQPGLSLAALPADAGGE
jgi:predicted MFS family arabinose efflux permease